MRVISCFSLVNASHWSMLLIGQCSKQGFWLVNSRFWIFANAVGQFASICRTCFGRVLFAFCTPETEFRNHFVVSNRKFFDFVHFVTTFFDENFFTWSLVFILKSRIYRGCTLWLGQLTRPNSKKASFILISGAPRCGLSRSPTPAHFLYISQFSISLPQPALTFYLWIHYAFYFPFTVCLKSRWSEVLGEKNVMRWNSGGVEIEFRWTSLRVKIEVKCRLGWTGQSTIFICVISRFIP